jgi:hypothetical protein
MSQASVGKARPKDFNRKKLFLNLLSTIGTAELTVFLDIPPSETHFTESIYIEQSSRSVPPTPFKIVSRHCGSEASSFLSLMAYIQTQNYPADDIIVILEDDYKVECNWISLLTEGLSFGSYVSLYDHPDKYSPMYKELQCKLFKNTRHWRTSPSTTNSFAVRARTLQEDLEIHQKYSTGVSITRDHEKFLHLWSINKSLVTSIPGAWSHEEINMQDLLYESPKDFSPEITYFS